MSVYRWAISNRIEPPAKAAEPGPTPLRAPDPLSTGRADQLALPWNLSSGIVGYESHPSKY